MINTIKYLFGSVRKIQIIDKNKVAVSSVVVKPMAMSITGVGMITDNKGIVYIPRRIGLQKTQYVIITVNGSQDIQYSLSDSIGKNVIIEV